MAACERPERGSEPGSDRASPEVVARRRSFLDRVRSIGYDVVPVVNFVPEPDPNSHAVLTALPEGRSARRRMKRRWRRRARKQARKRARQRARHPERFRVEFTDWVAIPWRDRPIEARLADFACATAGLIKDSAAWHGSVLDTHRLRLDPRQESSFIASRAYELYGLRRELGTRPGRGTVSGRAAPDEQGSAGNDVILDEAQTAYDERHLMLDESWCALLDRAAAFDSYRQHLDDLVPLLDSAATLRRLRAASSDADAAGLFADAAADELAASETRELSDEIQDAAGAMAAVLESLGGDMNAIR